MSSNDGNLPLPLGEGSGVREDANEVAIRVSNLSKRYEIYSAPRDRLKQFVMPPIRRILGRAHKQYFNEFWALKDISFEVKKGETVGIIGRNGSGKSTLLQIICGTLTPTSGSVETRGRIAALLELGSGFNPEFTGRENVYMNAAVLGLSSEEIDDRFEDIVVFSDIGDFIEQPVKTYSSGMMLRLAFAVIAHVDADILVIDEALSVGDVFFVQKCMRFLRQFMETGTVLFVSHDTGAVLNLCEGAIWLQDGVLAAKGEPKEITERYLEEFYSSQQGESSVKNIKNSERIEVKDKPKRDMRMDFINETALRNDIELFSFSADAKGFGKGCAVITNVRLLDEDDNELSWVVGGEKVKLSVEADATAKLQDVIIGFQVKDKLGQVIFADNTYLTYVEKPFALLQNEHVCAEFIFNMPVMPLGDYSISVALGEGTQERHIQHQWVHDALVFRVHSTSVCHGLIGVPMRIIEVKIGGVRK